MVTPSQQLPTRQRIKIVAEELLISYGYRGLRFEDIATRLGITRASIHYHFGTKAQLADEAIVDYLHEALAQLRQIWQPRDTSFAVKIDQIVEYCGMRYRRFNPGKTNGKPWSLVGRMRLESDVLTPRTREVLGTFSRELKISIRGAVGSAQEKGKFSSDAPTEEMVGHLVALIDCAPIITQYSGSFDELRDLFYGYLRLMRYAYPNTTPTSALNLPRR